MFRRVRRLEDKMRKIVYCFRFLILFVVVVSFVSITPNFCFAAREDVILGEEYQLESEKETLKDKFIWEIGLQYGYVFTKRAVNPWPGRPPQEYLDRLDMTYSKNYLSLGLGAKYLATSRLAVYAGMPFSFLQKEVTPRKRKGPFSAPGVGVGDVRTGISYALLPESKYRPLVVTTFEVTAPLSRFTSIGDGFWGFTPEVSLRKFISGPLYVKGLTSYTHRLDRKGIDPGAIINYGGGVGLLLGDKNNIELTLERAHIAKTKIGDRTLIDSNENMIMEIAYSSSIGDKQTSTIALDIGGLEDGFSWNQDWIGISFGFSF